MSLVIGVMAAGACSSDESDSAPTTTPRATTVAPTTTTADATTTIAATSTTVPPTTTTIAPTTTTVAPTTTAAPTTEAPTTTAAPTTTVDPLQPAREAFFGMISIASSAGATVAAEHPLGDWSDYPSYCGAMAPVAQELGASITAYAWPAEATTQAAALAAAHVQLADLYAQCAATDGSYEQLAGIVESLRVSHDTVSLANVELRVVIGLPADR